jgi:hypothetical protein
VSEPSKLDGATDALLERFPDALLALAIVYGRGGHSRGFEVGLRATTPEQARELQALVPGLLRAVADTVERDTRPLEPVRVYPDPAGRQ